MKKKTVSLFIRFLVFNSVMWSALAQEVSVPDSGLNGAIRQALQKPNGPLTVQDLLSLTNLDASRRSVGSIVGLQAARNLVSLDLEINRLASFSLPAELTKLRVLDLSDNQLTNISLPGDGAHLASLALSGNKLTSFTLPPGFTNLTLLSLPNNPLTHLTLPSDLSRLESLNLGGGQLTNFELPGGLAHLTELVLAGNQIINLTLPPDMMQLVNLDLAANPLGNLVLPEVLAATNLANKIAELQNESVTVFTYPLTVELFRIRQPIGAFQFAITGPPGIYSVLGSSDLSAWSVAGTVSNGFGNIVFTDGTAHLSPKKFYRALLQGAPTNMVFVPANTFMMGSSTNEPDRNVNETPQTSVTLTHGFWIGKYEVTQGEYLSLMHTNPSFFTGDLGRPISSVSWLEATNYCAKLTERELAEGRISPRYRYRLPSEAEWECAARAGTSTRFSYGDDPFYGSTTNYAWESENGGLTVHRVGEKLPNAWGIYDMQGNVWEWCQDWYGSLPGGTATDPQGPPGNSMGLKVMRGGAYDYPNSSCRSASRLSFALSPFLTDTDLGFRVVLAPDP